MIPAFNNTHSKDSGKYKCKNGLFLKKRSIRFICEPNAAPSATINVCISIFFSLKILKILDFPYAVSHIIFGDTAAKNSYPEFVSSTISRLGRIGYSSYRIHNINFKFFIAKIHDMPQIHSNIFLSPHLQKPLCAIVSTI